MNFKIAVFACFIANTYAQSFFPATESSKNTAFDDVLTFMPQIIRNCGTYIATQNIPCMILCGLKETGRGTQEYQLTPETITELTNGRDAIINDVDIPASLQPVITIVTDCLIQEGSKIQPMDVCTLDKITGFALCMTGVTEEIKSILNQ